MKSKQQIGIRDSLNLIKKSNNPLAPLIEGIANSLDSIKARQNIEIFTPCISVNFDYFKGLLDDVKDIKLKSISIQDNGIGFTRDCFERFKNLADKSKSLNNRGTGKIQMFHRFESINVESVFREDSVFHEVKMKYSIDDTITPDCPLRELESDDVEQKTTVTLDDFYGTEEEEKFFEKFLNDISSIKKEFYKHLLLRLHFERESGLQIIITTSINGRTTSSTEITSNDIPLPYETKRVKIKTSKPIFEKNAVDGQLIVKWQSNNSDNELEFTNFKFANNEIDENGIFLCSKGILVAQFKFSILRKNINYDGYKFITSIKGDLLDKNVNQAVDGFNFDSKKDIENSIRQCDIFEPQMEYIFKEDIDDAINDELSKIYANIKKLKEDKNEELEILAKKYGIPLEIAARTKVSISDSPSKITEKLLEEQVRQTIKQNIEIQETYEEILKLDATEFNPFDENYEKKFSECTDRLLKLIPQQNKEELSRYVLRRQMLVDMLRIVLKQEMKIQKKWKDQKEAGESVKEQHEALIHEMIFKRKSLGRSNDLWILNEEFVHFDGCSDLPLEQLEIGGKKILRQDCDIRDAMQKSGIEMNGQLKNRPDIFLFPDDNKCILIEFKAPDVELTKHLNQIEGYAKLISNFASIKITQFYGYLIGESIDKSKIPGRYEKSFSCKYWFNPSEPIRDIDTDLPIAHIYQEIIPYSTLADRAALRNKSFADRLGLTDSLEQAKSIAKKELAKLLNKDSTVADSNP